MQRRTLFSLVVLALILINFFYGLDRYSLANNNEGLYAEIAREMLANRQFIIPHLNGVPYLEKPPLLYWLIALSYQCFGVSTLAARLIPALSAAVICALMVYLGRCIKQPRAGWLAAFITASSLGFIVLAHIVFFDMLLTLLFSACLFFGYLWQQQQRLSFLRISYACLGLAVLTKGLLSLLLVPVIAVIYLKLTHTPWQQVKQIFDSKGLLLLLAITLPWHLLASWQQSGFAWDYFINEHMLRFLDKRWPADYYHGSIFYYLPRIILYLLPWSLLLPLLFRRIELSKAVKDLKILLWLWFIISLLFFSLSSAKANYYMMLGMPALVLLLAIQVDHLCSKHVTLYTALIGSIAVLSIASTIFLVHLAQKEQGNFSEARLAKIVLTYPHAQFYLYQDFEKVSSIVFYTQQRWTLVDSHSDDLAYGSLSSAAHGWFISTAELNNRCQQKPCLIIALKQKLPSFEQEVSGFTKLAESGTAVLLSKRLS